MTAMSKVSFGNIILAASGKQGILKPDDKGLYLLNAGAFNVGNFSGLKYPANDYIISQMEENSDLKRRVKMGYCKMEVEHPEPVVFVVENGVKYKKPMESVLQWINRLRSYDPDNICGLISEIIFEADDERDLSKPIWNFIRCKPFGPKGDQFRESLETPEHNTAVSIRTQISPFNPGDTQKNVEYWTGYDWVSDPGMVHANKHMTAGCESLLSDMFGINDNMRSFNVSDVLEQLDEALHTPINDNYQLERVGGMEALNHFKEVSEVMKANYKSGDKIESKISFTDIF